MNAATELTRQCFGETGVPDLAFSGSDWNHYLDRIAISEISGRHIPLILSFAEHLTTWHGYYTLQIVASPMPSIYDLQCRSQNPEGMD